MKIEGKCHCGNIRYDLEWPDAAQIPVRACGCTFCTKHGGNWTSNPDARLDAVIADVSRLSRYAFATSTADFYVCTLCGAVPFVISRIGDNAYAVVNVNTFDNVDTSSLQRSAADFEGEETGARLERRKRNWISSVNIAGV